MGNLYDWLIALIGIEITGTSQNSNVIYCACICGIVLFVVGVKLIFKGFYNLLGYNKIS